MSSRQPSDLPMDNSRPKQRPRRFKRSRVGVWLSIGLAASLVLVPLALVAYQARQTGESWGTWVQRTLFSASPRIKLPPPATAVRGEPIDFLTPRPIGFQFEAPPKISHIQMVDLDQDGLLDVVVCDCESNSVTWIRQHPADVFTEHILAEGLIAPAHVEAVDIDGDGDLDLLVAVLGMLFPNNDRIGSVVILENLGDQTFRQRVVLEGVARVSDVRAADLNGNGKLDLAVAQFGYDDGEVRWLENLGDWNFRSHVLLSRSGAIHCEIADFNDDGHPDIAVIVSQEWEEVYVFVGDGKGGFVPRRVFAAENPDYGSSGMWVYDLDGDGDPDIVFANGDAFDYLPPHPWPWHGVQWLENLGDLRFAYHRLADVGGAMNVQAADLTGNGQLDLVVASTFNDWDDPAAQSLVWLENQGAGHFVQRDITNTPSHVLALAVGDLNGDGIVDVVTGGMHVSRPYDRLGRIIFWQGRKPRNPSGSNPTTSGFDKR
jgi:hypothetical protein